MMYLSRFLWQFMCIITGFHQEPGYYHIYRTDVVPPWSLIKWIWLWVDESLTCFQFPDRSGPTDNDLGIFDALVR